MRFSPEVLCLRAGVAHEKVCLKYLAQWELVLEFLQGLPSVSELWFTGDVKTLTECRNSCTRLEG